MRMDLTACAPDHRITLPATARQELPLKGRVGREDRPHALLADVVPQQCTRDALVGMLACVQLPKQDAECKDV
jgi:hypothetical protein